MYIFYLLSGYTYPQIWRLIDIKSLSILSDDKLTSARKTQKMCHDSGDYENGSRNIVLKSRLQCLSHVCVVNVLTW